MEKEKNGGEKRMKKAVSVVFVALMAVAMLSLLVSPVIAAKPRTMTLTGFVVVLGVGTGTEFLAGKSDTYQVKFRDMPFLLEGDIVAGSYNPQTQIAIPGGFYHANEMVKLSGDRTWTGTWTMETATVVGVGSGSLKIGSSWDEDEPAATWWITGATGDLNGLKGRGTATQLSAYVFAYAFKVQIP